MQYPTTTLYPQKGRWWGVAPPTPTSQMRRWDWRSTPQREVVRMAPPISSHLTNGVVGVEIHPHRGGCWGVSTAYPSF